MNSKRINDAASRQAWDLVRDPGHARSLGTNIEILQAETLARQAPADGLEIRSQLLLDVSYHAVIGCSGSCQDRDIAGEGFQHPDNAHVIGPEIMSPV